MEKTGNCLLRNVWCKIFADVDGMDVASFDQLLQARIFGEHFFHFGSRRRLVF